MKGYVLGIDGGGTNTLAAITDHAGRVVGWGGSGSGNLDDVGEEAVATHLLDAVNKARQRAGLDAARFDAAFLGLAGIVSKQDCEAAQRIGNALQLAPSDFLEVDHDCRVALAGGLSGREGVVLIAGTGSSCYGRINGQAWRSGGWGHLISDEGSGYWYGKEALKAAVRAFDGRSSSTILLERVMQRLHLGHMNEVMQRLYVAGLSRSQLAALAPLVFEAAQGDDEVAAGLVIRGSHELADCVKAVAIHLGVVDSTFELALVGGLFHAGEVLISPLNDALLTRLPGCRPTAQEMPPALGGCLLALGLLGLKNSYTASAIRRSVAQLPPLWTVQ